ncbi:sensor histidine kinase [Streptomyces sp. G1]|uniref:sensor histidine kinase n=1 Tax=Streptomyces sp. G1 TaxID=361572 RepID=UPI00202FABE3|nr:sensor histidine kinase [Streptomyces sp. G1]MCM1976620.1 sensor histidine kinase [Streptomyces sp. G1]
MHRHVTHPTTWWPSRARPLPAGRPPFTRTVLTDAVLASVFFAVMLVEQLGPDGRPDSGTTTRAVLICAAVAGPLASRRTAPLASYLVGTAALSVEALWGLENAVSPYANLIGLYSLGLHASRIRAWCGPFAAFLGMIAYFAGQEQRHVWSAVPAGVLFLWLLVWAIGFGSARRLEERDATQLRLRSEVIASERARMARELHDLIGHTVNVMLVQAGATRRLLGRDPERAREVLAQLEDSGREALEELDRVLGLLRHSSTSPSVQPGLGDLSRLTSRMEQAGITVAARLEPGGAELPCSIDRTAYRIVQEALTNTVKHARAESADVTVRRVGDLLDIEVSDDGHGAGNGYAPGRGLLGIAERVAILGGRLEHGQSERGGFRLRVWLPVR